MNTDLCAMARTVFMGSGPRATRSAGMTSAPRGGHGETGDADRCGHRAEQFSARGRDAPGETGAARKISRHLADNQLERLAGAGPGERLCAAGVGVWARR